MTIRAIRAEDEDFYRDILERTTDEDRYCRFFHVVNHFDLNEIRRFVEPSSTMLGFIALEGERACGVVHACFLPDGRAELAIVVARDARRGGVARALVATLIDALVARNCRTLVAYALPDNHAMARLAKTFGMQPDPADASIVCWTLELPRRMAA